MFYSFESFCLDGSRRVLYHDGEPVSLPPRVVRALLLLVRQRGKELNKKELMEQLWPDCVVEENNLTVIISALRKVLGDDREERRYIVTIPGTGYSFVADTIESETRPPSLTRERDAFHADAAASLGNSAFMHTVNRIVASTISANRIFAVIVLSLFLTLAAAWSARRWVTAHANTRPAVTVLPFESLGFGVDADYLRLGMADALGERLRRLNSVRVLSVNSPAYQNSAYDPLATGRNQGADAVLTGTVRRASGVIAVSARLLSVKDTSTIWSGDFTGEITDILTIQDRIAEKASYALTHVPGVPRGQRRTRPFTPDPDAYQLYLHGMYFLDRRTHYQGQEGLNKAITYLQQAIEKDPKFAAAYVSLAIAYNRLSWYVPAENSIVRAEALAQKALSIDPDLPDAYRVLGFARQTYEWDLAGAVTAYRRSLELDPEQSATHRWYADALVAMGRSQEALSEARKGLELDPSSAELDALGHVYFFSHRYDDAIVELRSKQDVDPNVSWFLAWLYSRPGERFPGVSASSDGSSQGKNLGVCEFAYAEALAGKDDLGSCLRHLHQKMDVSPYNVALLYVALNDNQNALKWLERARDTHAWELIFINVDPRLDSLRSDPGFETLLDTMHMRQS